MTQLIPDVALYGYTSQFSVSAGEEITFHVSGYGAAAYDAELVRLFHGLEVPGSPGFIESSIEAVASANYPLEEYATGIGSYVEVSAESGPLTGSSSVIGIELGVYSTLLDRPIQGLIGTWSETTGGYALVLADGRLQFWAGDASDAVRVELSTRIETHTWYRVSAGFDLTRGVAWLEQTPYIAKNDRHLASSAGASAEKAETPLRNSSAIETNAPFRIGALSSYQSSAWTATAHFNGKLSNPEITGRDGKVIAAWHFGQTDRADGALLRHVADVSGNALHGQCVNTPARAVTGPTWDGRAENFVSNPNAFGAIHFHEDDLDDARWPVAFRLTVPDTLSSGVYAMKLTAAEAEEHIPFFVSPGAHQSRSQIALLIPTGSYLAYANDRLPFDAAGAELLIGHLPVLHQTDFELQAHYDFGRSCYEVHPDSSGVTYSSRRRPILNMRPKSLGWFMAEGPWQFPADLCIVHWLEQMGVAVDVITDEDLHREGIDLLSHYQVVITGSHPEYISTPEMDAVEGYVAAGGRLMYLGGNGFYWRVSYDPEKPYLMEVRRPENGSRPHQSAPGEHHHSTTGESCGMWRSKGRSPQRLLGVGMGSEGFDRSSPYRRMPDSYLDQMRFVFDGVDSDTFGDFGLMGGGAAGAELDRYDASLGSSPNSYLLASSIGAHSDDYQQASEDLFETPPITGGTQNLDVRSDVVLVPHRGGGAVFSVGSIAWTAALSHNSYDNAVARISENILRRFLSGEPLGDDLGAR